MKDKTENNQFKKHQKEFNSTQVNLTNLQPRIWDRYKTTKRKGKKFTKLKAQ
jgi:hypothetical protein